MNNKNKNLIILDDGFSLKDGGLLFGSAPRTVWSKYMPPDDDNRVLTRNRVLIVKQGKRIILVDSGVGAKNPDNILLQNTIKLPKSNIIDNLKSIGIKKNDITDVILTHLHSHCCGWNLRQNKNKELVTTFPNATYWVQKGELDVAQKPHKYVKKHYNSKFIKALIKSEQIKTIEGSKELYPNVNVHVFPGHTADFQIVTFKNIDKTVAFMGDLVPTIIHINPSLISSYDIYPLKSFNSKKELIKKATDEKWELVFQSDPYCINGTIKNDSEIECVEKDSVELIDNY